MVAASNPPAGMPPLYARWLAAALDGALPGEPLATCDHCAMLDGAPPAVAFDPGTKCCTYTPAVPNFLAGAILADPDPAAAAGHASLRARIAARAAVTPLGLGPTRSQQLIHDHVGRAFGRATALRCPHYVDRRGGECGIWRHRNAVCATWFCKHAHGAAGFALWRAVEALLTSAERALAVWAALDAGVDAEVLVRALPPRHARPLDALDADDIDGREPPGYAALWGPWHDREDELYLACAARVASLAWRDVERICGPELALHRRVTQARLTAVLHPAQPARPRAAAYRVVQDGRETVRLQTYSPYDPIELPAQLVHALHGFDGRPVAEALQRIADHYALELTPDLVQSLVDFGVLVDADPAERSP